jgi:hypothetical protein
MADDDTLAEIVPLFAEAEAAIDDAPIHTQEAQRCFHDKLRLDTDARRVYCRDCGSEVDPFTGLVNFSKTFERYRSSLDSLRAEVRRHGNSLEEIKRLERNAKNRLKTVMRKLPPEPEWLHRVVAVYLRTTVAADGPIDAKGIGSAAKRITSGILEQQQPIDTARVRRGAVRSTR